MISTAFVNCDAETVYSSDYGYKIVRECDEITESVMKAIHDYESHLEEYKFESSINGEIDEDEITALEAEGDNVFKKIGNGVMNLIKKLIDMIQKFIDKIRNSGFAKKSDMDKIEVMCKKHPELKEQIIANASSFDFSQIRNIADMEENYNKIMKMTDKSKKKEAIEKFKKGAATAVAVAAGTGTVIKLGEALVRLKNSHKNMTEKCQKTLESKRDRARKLQDDLSRMTDLANERLNSGHTRYNDNPRVEDRYLNDNERTKFHDMEDEVTLLNSQIAHLNREFNNFNNQQSGIFRKIMQVVNGYNPNSTN